MVRLANAVIGLGMLAAPFVGTADAPADQPAVFVTLVGALAGVLLYTVPWRPAKPKGSGKGVFLTSYMWGAAAALFGGFLLGGRDSASAGEWFAFALGLGFFYSLGFTGLRYAVWGGPFWKRPEVEGAAPDQLASDDEASGDPPAAS